MLSTPPITNVPMGPAVQVPAIETVTGRWALLDPAGAARLLETIRRERAKEDRALATLTEQERHVLQRLATGRSNREIGEALALSEKSVKNHVSRILAKLGLRRRAEAAAYAAARVLTA